MLNERLQILIRPDQRQRLEAEAKRRHTSVAMLIREAVDARFGAIVPAERSAAVEAIRGLNGAFIPPAKLGQLSDQECEATLTAALNGRR